jgi:hypothetical protein
VIGSIPLPVKKAFNNAPSPATPEERLWRERAARMTLDALGYTNLTMKPKRHNEAVRYARRWYRGLFEEAAESDSPSATFDAAGLEGFPEIRNAVLAADAFTFPDRFEE